MTTKEFFVNAVNLINIEGSETIPTVLYFESEDHVYFGNEAIEKADTPENINENFKVDLGNHAPGANLYGKKRFATAGAREKSATELTHKFFDLVLENVEKWISINGHQATDRILVAEPLSFHVEDKKTEWLPNYRKNIKRILQPTFKRIDFLPEPFAVFQYYRYGLKHPWVRERKKYLTLVIDFGGGTFDISVVETTRQGDISSSGKHSRPLAAASVPIGGFHINEVIAEDLIMLLLSDSAEKVAARKGIVNHHRWRKGELDISALNIKNKAFIRWFDRLIYEVEPVKIALTGLISNWTLDADIKCAIPIEVPIDPFEPTSQRTRMKLHGKDVRRIFEEKIWSKHLKHVVRDALKRAEKELKGREINLILLSGGSANIRWTQELLQRDFHEEFHSSKFISLSEDFQHIVAKGLAVECARRSFDPDAEFRTVTYNPLFLVLEPDARGLEIKPYRNVTDSAVNGRIAPGQLLPSASALRKFIGEKIKWKVRLKHPPKRHLDYYFLRGTLDIEDYESLYNIDHRIHTDSSTKFDSFIIIELDIRGDGTCIPRFVYKTDRNGKPLFQKEGKPFCIDMTVDSGEGQSSSYLGFDFGSSNTSVSYVDEEAIDVIEGRSGNQTWLGLNELVELLPYPVSDPLRRYLGAIGADRQAKATLSVVEACLAFAGYTAYAEYCVLRGRKISKLFKEFALGKRSAGPLKAFLEQTLAKLPRTAKFSSAYKELFIKHEKEISELVKKLNDYKHEKLPASEIRDQSTIEILANAINNALDGCYFGHFEDVTKKRFQQRYEGIFRVAGAGKPFFQIIDYEGNNSFSEDEAFLLDIEEGRALSLSPLVFWELGERSQSGEETCLFFDVLGRSKADASYIVVGEWASRQIDAENYSEIVQFLIKFEEEDPHFEMYADLVLKKRGEW